MADWVYAQRDPAEELAQLYYFSFKKRQPEGEIEFVITVKEFASRNAAQMRFYAQADRQVNQSTAPFRPFGWGDSLLTALTECVSTHPPVSLRARIAAVRLFMPFGDSKIEGDSGQRSVLGYPRKRKR